MQGPYQAWIVMRNAWSKKLTFGIIIIIIMVKSWNFYGHAIVIEFLSQVFLFYIYVIDTEITVFMSMSE